MIKKKQKQLIHFYMVSDITAILAAFFFSFSFRFHWSFLPSMKGIPSLKQYLIVIPILLLAHIVHFSYQGFYKIKLRRNRLDDLFLVVLNSLVTVVIVILAFSFFRSYSYVDFEISRMFLLVYFIVTILCIFGFRLLVFNLYKKKSLKQNGISHILIIGDDDIGQTIHKSLEKYAHFGIEVCGFLTKMPKESSLGIFSDFEKVVQKYRITDVFITLSLEDSKQIADLIKRANNLMIDVKLIPDIIYLASVHSGLEHIEGIPVINLDVTPSSGWGGLFKRIFDIVFSFFGLLIFLPFGLIISLVIKISSKGPVFYKQERVGFDGKHFQMIKFRTMSQDAESGAKVKWSQPNTDKITKPGKILRKMSIDEVPQLLNVLKGDMSLVGPRPERPEFVIKFREEIPKYMLRHKMKTGMTGWAQVHGLRGDTSLTKRIEYDIFYIKNWSFRLDLGILWRTVLKFKFIDSKEKK